MKNYVQDGNTVTITAGGTITSGDVDSLNDIVGVAQNDAASGESVVYATVGVYLVAKATAQTWKVGESVNFDASAGNFTTGAAAAAGDVTDAAVAWADAASGDTTGYVKINVGAGTGS